MKDLDFDELDREIKTLMGGSSAPSTPRVPSPSPNEPHATESTAPPAIKSPLARRGRFMDMVHSSVAPDKQAIPTPVRREAPTLEPVISTPHERTATPAPDAPVSTNQDPSGMLDANKELDELLAKPLSLDDTLAAPKEQASSDKGTHSVESPQEETLAESKDTEKPMTLPFIPGTKVEKRPLGSNSSIGSDLQPLDVHDELMVIENADTTGITQESQAIPPEAAPQSEPPLVKEDTPVATEEKEIKDESETRRDTPVVPLVTSIAKQYREEVPSKVEEPGSIYDTSSYHQPLSHPAAKSSGWSWVMWILLILIIGAIVGGAVYYFTM